MLWGWIWDQPRLLRAPTSHTAPPIGTQLPVSLGHGPNLHQLGFPAVILATSSAGFGGGAPSHKVTPNGWERTATCRHAACALQPHGCEAPPVPAAAPGRCWKSTARPLSSAFKGCQRTRDKGRGHTETRPSIKPGRNDGVLSFGLYINRGY